MRCPPIVECTPPTSELHYIDKYTPNTTTYWNSHQASGQAQVCHHTTSRRVCLTLHRHTSPKTAPAATECIIFSTARICAILRHLNTETQYQKQGAQMQISYPVIIALKLYFRIPALGQLKLFVQPRKSRDVSIYI